MEVLDEYLGKITDWSSLKWFDTCKSHHSDCISKEKNVKRLSIIFDCKLWNLTRLFINLWVYKKDTYMCNQILIWALLSDSPTNWLLSVCDKLPYDNTYELLMYSVGCGKYESSKYLIEQNCGDDIFNKIAELSEDGGGILHYNIVDQILYRESLSILVDTFNENFVKNITEFIRFLLR